jgi:hypothetical protein
MDTEIQFIADDETGEVTSPRELELPERYALEAWMPPDGSKMNILQQAAYWRNVYRIAESYGPNLIAMLAQAGALEPEQDPEQALRNVLKAAGF